MSQCPKCRSVISHNETFCGQCGTKISPQQTTVLGTATTAIDFVAATVPALNNTKAPQNTKRFLVVFTICLLLFGIFVCGQVTKFGSVTAKEKTSGNNAPSGLQLPQPTQQPTQVPTPKPIPTQNQTISHNPLLWTGIGTHIGEIDTCSITLQMYSQITGEGSYSGHYHCESTTTPIPVWADDEVRLTINTNSDVTFTVHDSGKAFQFSGAFKGTYMNGSYSLDGAYTGDWWAKQ